MPLILSTKAAIAAGIPQRMVALKTTTNVPRTTAAATTTTRPWGRKLIHRHTIRRMVEIVAAIIGPPRDYWYMARFPEWAAYGPAIASGLAISVTYVVMVILGHGVMRLVPGPARGSPLARRNSVTARPKFACAVGRAARQRPEDARCGSSGHGTFRAQPLWRHLGIGSEGIRLAKIGAGK